jgi:hypothetical protein
MAMMGRHEGTQFARSLDSVQLRSVRVKKGDRIAIRYMNSAECPVTVDDLYAQDVMHGDVLGAQEEKISLRFPNNHIQAYDVDAVAASFIRKL